MFFRKPKTKLDEIFTLENQYGDQIEIPVILDASTALPRYNRAEATLQTAKLAIAKEPNSKAALDTLGQAAIDQLAVVFGEDGVKKMFDFVNGNADLLLRSCYPYIKKRVLPVLKASSAQRKKELLKQARRR